MAYRILKGGVTTAATADDLKKAQKGEEFERVEYKKGEVAKWLPKDAIPWLLDQGEIEEVKDGKVSE